VQGEQKSTNRPSPGDDGEDPRGLSRPRRRVRPTQLNLGPARERSPRCCSGSCTVLRLGRQCRCDHQALGEVGNRCDVLHEGKGINRILSARAYAESRRVSHGGFLGGCCDTSRKEPELSCSESSTTPHVPSSSPAPRCTQRTGLRCGSGLFRPSRHHHVLAIEVERSGARRGDDAQAVPLVGACGSVSFSSAFASQALINAAPRIRRRAAADVLPGIRLRLPLSSRLPV